LTTPNELIPVHSVSILIFGTFSSLTIHRASESIALLSLKPLSRQLANSTAEAMGLVKLTSEDILVIIPSMIIFRRRDWRKLNIKIEKSFRRFIWEWFNNFTSGHHRNLSSKMLKKKKTNFSYLPNSTIT
jgi:hypothetical protein